MATVSGPSKFDAVASAMRSAQVAERLDVGVVGRGCAVEVHIRHAETAGVGGSNGALNAGIPVIARAPCGVPW